MSAQFTPGPWTFSQSTQYGDARFYVSQQEGAPYTPHYSDVATLIAETVGDERRSIQEANARLIAAAPELLDALTGYMAAVEEFNASMNDGINVHGAMARLVGEDEFAKHVIAKATGSAA